MVYIVKICGYFNAKFYVRRKTARFCSDICRVYYYLEKHRSNSASGHDPNEGKILAPSTVPSEEIPENKLVFIGDLASLYCELKSYIIPPEELTTKKESIERIKPYSETNKWDESITQILTDEYFIEVFRIFPAEYKLYVWPWGENNPEPFIENMINNNEE